jgi:hypothetical protein
VFDGPLHRVGVQNARRWVHDNSQRDPREFTEEVYGGCHA